MLHVARDIFMKKITHAAFVSVAAIALSACGSSDSADQAAVPENVEMPAEEAIGGVDAAATPVADASASVAASPAADAAATGAATAAAAPTDAASAAAEAATADAEKKM